VLNLNLLAKFQLFILCVLAIFSVQISGYAFTTSPIYAYDTGGYYYIDRDIDQYGALEDQKQSYDDGQNFFKPVEDLQPESTDAKPLLGAFLALFGKVVVTNSGLLKNANFAQNNIIPLTKEFSGDGIKIFSALAGKPIRTVGDLTDALRTGVLKPSQVPVDFVDINGTRLILNTRTSTALQNAGFSRSQFFGRNRTGQTAFGSTTFDDLARQQLKRNGLPSTGSPTLGN